MAMIGIGEKFDIGRVVNRAFGAIGRNAVLFLGLAVLLEFLPSLLIRSLKVATVTSDQLAAFGVVSLAAGVAGLVLYCLFQAAIVHATAVDLGGGKPAIGPSLALAARLVLPLAGLAIVSFFGFMVGMMLLIVPGVILALMWFVAVPALVEERRGIFASLGRSRALTSGSRWRLFALAVVMAILVYLPFIVFALVGGGFMATSLAMAQLSWVGMLFQAFNALVVLVISTIVASAYFELRAIKDGATPESLASIFA